ncbi:hypothetical protein [Parachryseolinea silvisoli]|uniref:hypothetical protein n=1 Tax=Parachryseolinea silvisoli TaxID=2873601 RepID=UPI002265D177|nr:hypothetical protein [Parachryseolinea silvisoli]MCD9015506.1 hypothetical protein [Parachryseolinea silvisoli]
MAIPFLSLLRGFARSALVVSIILAVTLACADRKSVSSGPIAERLVACQVLEDGQQGVLTAALTGSDSSSSAIIAALLQVQYKGMGANYSDWTTYTLWDTVGSPEAIARVEKLLDGLMECQVIDDQQRRIVQLQIVPEHLYHPVQVLTKLNFLAAYKAYIAPAPMLAFADSLHRAGIVPDDRYAALKGDIRAGKLARHYQLLDYVEHGVHFDLAQQSGDPSKYLPVIYRRVADILPELGFTDFQYEIIKDEQNSSPDYVAYNAVVSFNVNGIPYRHKSFIAPEHTGKRHGYLGYIDEHAFYQIFNQVLADHRSPYRLHLVPALMQYFPGNYQYFGIIALTQTQTSVIPGGTSLFGIVQEESFEHALTADDINQAIHTFRQTGLLSHLTSAQVDSAVADRPMKIGELLLSLPGVVFAFDAELNNLEHPYEEILQSFARISHGVFHPTNIQDDFDLDHTHGEVTFQLAGKKYSHRFGIEGDWVDPGFLTYVFGLPAELKLAGRFYSFPGDGQVAHFIYLTPPQALVLKERYKLDLK